jgi:glutathione S-transferase
MVRVALYEKGLEFDHKIIRLCDHYEEADNLSKDYLKDINPTGVVPVLKIDDEFVRDSAYIIERIDSLKGSNDIKLWPENTLDNDKLRKWVYDTTITEGVAPGKTLGTSIPLFSTGLIETLIKRLSLKAIFNIVMKHPRRERKIAFLVMYFLSLKNRIGPIAYNGFIDGLIDLENSLPDDAFLFNDFSHADINLMCCFHRLVDMRLDSILEMDEFPKICNYWNKLKSRPSYQKGIINFSDHEELLSQSFPNDFNPHLEKLKDKIKIKSTK